MEKLEWCGYPMVKKIRRYLYSDWRNSRTWQTDRHRMTAIAALMHSIARQKSSDLHEILYTVANFELDERTWSKMKKLHRTDSEFDRTYFLFDKNIFHHSEDFCCFCMCHFAMGLTHCYKTTFLHLYDNEMIGRNEWQICVCRIRHQEMPKMILKLYNWRHRT